jgi:hypothetical protein
MRLVKFSDKEFPNEDALERYFAGDLSKRTPKGLVFCPPKIAEHGIYVGETILFSYRNKLRYVAKAETPRMTNIYQHEYPENKKYPYCFCIKLPGRKANVPLQTVGENLRAEAGLDIKLRGQGWTIITDDKRIADDTRRRVEKVIEDLSDATTPLANDMPDEFKPLSDYAPTADEGELQDRVSKLRKKKITAAPTGQVKPATVATASQAYVRDPMVKAWVLQNAKGMCEGCGSPAPFTGDDGEPFLECHHVLPLADGGSDTITNATALCPNLAACIASATYRRLNPTF